MLQQTTVGGRRAPATTAFLDRFPDLRRAGAGPRRSSVLAAWSGLGYYARARNLHAAARADPPRARRAAARAIPRPCATLPGLRRLHGRRRRLARLRGAAARRSTPTSTRVLSRLFAIGGVAGTRAPHRAPCAGASPPSCPARPRRPHRGAHGSRPADLHAAATRLPGAARSRASAPLARGAGALSARTKPRPARRSGLRGRRRRAGRRADAARAVDGGSSCAASGSFPRRDGRLARARAARLRIVARGARPGASRQRAPRAGRATRS